MKYYIYKSSEFTNIYIRISPKHEVLAVEVDDRDGSIYPMVGFSDMSHKRGVANFTINVKSAESSVYIYTYCVREGNAINKVNTWDSDFETFATATGFK